MPASQLCASHGWLNQVARTEPAVVTHFDRENAQASFAERPRRIGQHLDPNRRLHLRLQAGNRDNGAVAVAVGEAQEQIADSPDARFRGGLRQLGPDPVQDIQRDVEHARARPVHRRVEQLRPGQLAKRRQRTASLGG